MQAYRSLQRAREVQVGVALQRRPHDEHHDVRGRGLGNRVAIVDGVVEHVRPPGALVPLVVANVHAEPLDGLSEVAVPVDGLRGAIDAPDLAAVRRADGGVGAEQTVELPLGGQSGKRGIHVVQCKLRLFRSLDHSTYLQSGSVDSKEDQQCNGRSPHVGTDMLSVQVVCYVCVCVVVMLITLCMIEKIITAHR